ASNGKIILGKIFKRYFCPPRPESTPDVLMVTRADLFPVDHGAAVKIIRTAESLSRTGRDVWLTTDSRTEYFQFSDGKMTTHRFPFLLRFLCQPRIVASMKLLKLGFPYSNSFLYMPVTDMSFTVRAIYLASRKPIGAYQAEFPAYVRPCRFARSLFEGKILLVQHNVEYDRISNKEPDLTPKNIQTLKNLELAMCHEADNIIAVSDNDRDKMIADGIDAEKIHTIPHGVDLQAFHTTPSINIRERYRLPWQTPLLVYHGTYSYSPNLEAMQVMAREILPRLEERDMHVTVLAIGSKPPDFPLHPNIVFVGSVDNLAEVIPATDLAVVPLQEGGGTRMKILDYFAAGIPVISTAKGIEGIPVENGKQALIIDDFDAISDAIVHLLRNPQEGKKLSDQASLFVETLGWDAIGRRYLPLLH
ncbi:MAG: glycosyltransferase family 4 protein, partial [Gammaproteobacteria bacterium]|nr:glycosyltransferase family 4 protein [Gammaproteobacteria bacterium]